MKMGCCAPGGRTRCLEEALDSLQRDGEAEGQQEDTVDERCKDFSSVPAVRIPRVDLALVGHLDEAKGMSAQRKRKAIGARTLMA